MEQPAIDCPYRVQHGPFFSCMHVTREVGEIPIHETACLHCVKLRPTIEDRKNLTSKDEPVMSYVHGEKSKRHLALMEKEGQRTKVCANLGERVRDNPMKPGCGACAFYECEANMGTLGIIQLNVDCPGCPSYQPKE